MDFPVRYKRFGSRAGEPLAQVPGHELWPVVGAKMLQHTFHHRHIGQRFDHPGARPPPFRPDHQTFSAVLVDQIQHPHCNSVICFRAHEVVTPYMVRVLRPPPHARSIVEPQPPPRLLLLRNLQPFATPDALYPALADLPAVLLQHRRDPAVAVASILGG